MFPKKIFLFFSFSLIFICPSFFAQTKKIDEIKIQVVQAKTPGAKIEALLKLCNERNSLKTDSLLAYAQAARLLAQKQGDERSTINSFFFTAAGLSRNTLYDSAIFICDSSIGILNTKPIDEKLLIEFKNLKAQTLIRKANLKEALSLLYELLHQTEMQNDTAMQVKIKCNIGWLHMEMTQYREGITWFHKALATTSNMNYINNYPPLYTTLASCYNNIYSFDSALFYVNKGIINATETQQLSFLANGLNIRADIYLNTNKNAAAEADLTKALGIRKQVGDPFYIVSDITQLAYFYAVTGNYKQGEAIVMQGLDTAAKYNLQAKIFMLYNALSENYKRSGDYKSYSEVQEKLIQLKDSLYEKNSAQALAGLQAKYDVQKKENIIIQQKLDIVNKDYWFYGMLILFIFLGTIALVQYFNNRKKEKIKLEKLLEQQQLKETIAVIKAEEKERKRIAADLHDNLGAYAAAISNNVRSVKTAGTYSEALNNRLEENAQDIVNELNNTIWVLKKETQQLTEISDRLKVWIQKIIHNYPGIQYDFNEQIDNDITLSPGNALQLFHILQECINNALRHSRCTKLLINFFSAENNWHIKVSDNGIGFNVAAIQKGNGIINIQERAAACGWQIEWQQQNGTVVGIRN